MQTKPSNGGQHRMTDADKQRYTAYMAKYINASWSEQFSAMIRIKTAILNGWAEVKEATA
jgi:hypothetical protein